MLSRFRSPLAQRLFVDGRRKCVCRALSSQTVVRTGGCACGNIRFEIHNDPMIVHACHCTDCQRHSGSPFTVNAWTEASNLEFIENTQENVATSTLPSSGSGKPHNLCFCPSCSTAIYSQYQAPHSVFVRVHTLDNPSSLSPDVHIWTRSKPDWLDLSSIKNVPMYEEYYKMKLVWRPESIGRFRALMKEHGVSNHKETVTK